MAIFLCAVKDNIKIVTLNSFGENCYFECIYNEKSIEIQALRRKSGAEPIPLFRETLRLDCFPNGPGAMLSFKQIFQTGSSLRMTFVGHKVNWGGPGPGQGTPLSLLSLATARHSENLRMVHWDFLLLPVPGCGHWEMRAATRVIQWPGHHQRQRVQRRALSQSWMQTTFVSKCNH